MKNPNHYITDTRMLQLIEKLKGSGKINYTQDFCDVVGVLKQNFVNIRNGTQHFRIEHITKACKVYKVDANWIHGLSKEPFLPDTKSNTRIKETRPKMKV